VSSETSIHPQIPGRTSDSLTRRLLRGFGATALSPLVTAVVQLGSVPLLLHAWGPAKYGDWLLLAAIPTYMSFSDLGFGDASGSDMSMRVAARDRAGALETFQSSWVLVTIVSFVALLVVSLSVWWMPWRAWLHLSSVSNHQAAMIVLVLAAYIAVSQQDGVAESGYRSDGHFATGTIWISVQRLGETVAATLVALLGGSLLAVACAYLAVRCVGVVAYAIYLCHLSPWIQYGIRHARMKTIKKLAAPAMGFIAFPLGTAVSLQGFTIVIGAVLGPIAVVSFSTLRTLSRVTYQLVIVVKHGIWPELSRTFGEGDISMARRLNRFAWQASLGISVVSTAFLWFAGPYVYHVWLHRQVAFDASCFHVLLLVVVVNSLWDIGSVIAMSINGHCRIAVLYSAAACASLGLAWILLPTWGTLGAAVALLAMDGFMTVFVLRTALKYTNDSLSDFSGSLLSIPRLPRIVEIAPGA
jgi:O-antigen/teichoic acid export membrane protein